MDLLIGGITLILVVIVILSPFFQRRLFAMTVNQEEDSYIEESNLIDMKEVLELDYALGNMSEEDYLFQLSEYDNRIQNTPTRGEQSSD
jgi:uncharacterized membrane protein|tara:strand:- start:1234 stop:1500 length:267 start_codon:yes stop_codon:yes gene_type:complete